MIFVIAAKKEIASCVHMAIRVLGALITVGTGSACLRAVVER